MDMDLRLGDCLEILPTLEIGSIDAVVTDPPYGINFDYDKYDDTPEGHGDFVWSAISLAESICRDASPIMVFQSATNFKHFTEWFPRDWKILIAAKNFVQIRPGPSWHAYDPVITWWKNGQGIAYGKVRRDFFVADTTPSGRKRRNEIVEGHPCPRPIEHLLWLVSTWTKPNGTVLDPFMGSGTTGVACVKTGRNFIGIEIDPGYYAIAEKRIAEAKINHD